jgi:hypothetical protein
MTKIQFKIKEWLQGNQHVNIKVALAYIIIIMVAYSSIIFLGRTLQPILYYPIELDGITTEENSWSYQGRTPINTFNIDLATPAYYEWPINYFVGDSYLKGEIPIWNPYQAAGDPLAVQYSSRVFFPYQILENISPTWTWDYFILGRLWFAGFLTFLFLISLRLSTLPAFLGGIFYMLSGSFVWFINLEQMVNVAMVLPFMMFAIDKLAIQRNGSSIALAAIAMALVLLGGQPEVALYVLTLGGLYMGFRSFNLHRRNLNQPLLGFVIAGLLALGLAAPLLLPFIEYLGHAYHMHLPSRNLGIISIPEFRWLITIFIPTFFDQQTFFRVGPMTGVWDYLGGYIGILPLLLGFLALIQSKTQQQKYLIFFLTVGSCIILKNAGVFPFKYIGALPLFDQTWSLRWAGPVWTFSFAVAAALAVEMLWKRNQKIAVYNGGAIETDKVKKPTKMIWILSSMVGVCLTMYVIYDLDTLKQLFFSNPITLFTGCLVALLTLVIALMIIKNWHDSRKGLYALIALALNELLFAIPKGYPPEFLYLKLIPFLIGLFVVWECGKQRWKRVIIGTLLVAFAYGGIDYVSPRGFPDQDDPFTPPASYVEFLQKQTGLFRVMGGGGVLMPNFASAVGIYDVRFVSSLTTATYHHFMSHFLRRNLPVYYHSLWFTGIPDRSSVTSIDKVVKEVGKDIQSKLRFYSILGVKYFIFPRSSHFIRKYIDASNFRLVYNKEVRIYENLNVLPRSFIVHQIRHANNYQKAQTLASHKNFNFRKQAIVEERIPNVPRVAQKPSYSNTKIVEYSAKKVELKVQTSHSGLAILTDVYYPGWQAEVNGQPAKIYRVNGLFRGVWLPKGEHKVVFSYWPMSFQIGFTLAGISGLICFILILVPVLRKRQITV